MSWKLLWPSRTKMTAPNSAKLMFHDSGDRAPPGRSKMSSETNELTSVDEARAVFSRKRVSEGARPSKTTLRIDDFPPLCDVQIQIQVRRKSNGERSAHKICTVSFRYSLYPSLTTAGVYDPAPLELRPMRSSTHNQQRHSQLDPLLQPSSPTLTPGSKATLILAVEPQPKPRRASIARESLKRPTLLVPSTTLWAASSTVVDPSRRYLRPLVPWEQVRSRLTLAVEEAASRIRL